MLGLFGFDLPRTHERYFLAHDAGDCWRRINIYWKEFMTKAVYFPVFFRLRRRATSPRRQRRGLAVATSAVFVASWLLHGYQWFWLLGSFPLRPQDLLFWGAVGLWVVAFTLRRGGTRRPAPGGWRRLRGIALTFSTVAVLWSLWTAESLAEWVQLWSAARVPPVGVGELVWLLGPAAVLAAWGAGRALERRWLEGRWVAEKGEAPTGQVRPAEEGGRAETRRPAGIHRRALPTSAAAVGLLGLFLLPSLVLPVPTSPRARAVPAQEASALDIRLRARLAVQLQDLGTRRLGATEAARLERGYYEKVLRVNRLDSPLVASLAAAGAGGFPPQRPGAPAHRRRPPSASGGGSRPAGPAHGGVPGRSRMR